MRGERIPDSDHIVRHVPWSKLRKDEDDNVLGVLGEAFRRREGEDTLSVNWVEYFDGEPAQQRIATVQCMRGSELRIRPNSKCGYAIGNVGLIADVCRERSGRIRVIHEPVDSNEGHADVRRLPRDNDGLLDLLAADVWSGLLMNTDVP